jgi:hypothetical protein
MPKTSRLLATSMFLLAVPAVSAQTPLQLAVFSSIEVNSGHVVIRSAPTQRVTLLKGSLAYTRVAVTDAGVLVIDKCNVHCPRGYELEVEIQVPSVSRVSLANGGWIRSQGTFVLQTDLTARVAHGGTIDVRSMAVDRVTASVEQGGRILTVPRGSLFARVNQGGVITYWGNPQVRSSVQHGGVVDRGSANEINLPLGEVGPALLSPLTAIHRTHR